MDNFRTVTAMMALLGMIALSATNTIPLLDAALLTSAVLIAIKCLSVDEAMR